MLLFSSQVYFNQKDIVRFTDYSAGRDPTEVVNMLSELFRKFDDAAKDCNVYKVHTIGDCYVVIGFTGKVARNERNLREEAKNVVCMGERMIDIIKEIREKVCFPELDMRIGIHTVFLL
jgi:phospholipid-translocating ATPase